MTWPVEQMTADDKGRIERLIADAFCRVGGNHYCPNCDNAVDIPVAALRACLARVEQAEAERDEINAQLVRLGLEPWPDGRSVSDHKRPWAQHLGMVLSALVAERDSLHNAMDDMRHVFAERDALRQAVSRAGTLLARAEQAEAKRDALRLVLARVAQEWRDAADGLTVTGYPLQADRMRECAAELEAEMATGAQAQVIPVADRERALELTAEAAEEGDSVRAEIELHQTEPWRWQYPQTYLSDDAAYACARAAVHNAAEARRLLRLE